MGVYWRDLKPANLMQVPLHDGSLVVKVLDFGLARVTLDAEEAAGEPSASITRDTILMGTASAFTTFRMRTRTRHGIVSKMIVPGPGPEPQVASAVLMIRPTRFAFNAQTAVSNTYQVLPAGPAEQVHAQAVREFDGFRALLGQHGVAVRCFDDPPSPHTPDSIFPNNWFSTHSDGTLVLYPLATENRRLERRAQLIEALRRGLGIRRVLDLTAWEAQGKYLEGTGSLVLDRTHRVAYAALSVRTDPEVVEHFARLMGYRPLLFTTAPHHGQPVYHTNVVVALGQTTAVVCLDAVAEGRATIEAELRKTGRSVIPISVEQCSDFAGNLLLLRSQAGDQKGPGPCLWVMSSRAYKALSPRQREELAAEGQILHSPLSTIESVGGGSARCMLAELFSEQVLDCRPA